MHKKLLEIIEAKKHEVDALRKNRINFTDHDIPPGRDFKAAISVPEKINLIAEIKFASPSAGLIREKTDPCEIGNLYETSGAAAISLLTDRQFFGGDLKELPKLKKAVTIPVLRKDFIIDEIQIREAALYGADAILLIARILTQQQLNEFTAMCRELELASLTEIHDEDDLEKTMESGADIIGINNRDLDTFKVDKGTALRLATMIPEDRVIVGESGIENSEDIRKLKGSGINAVLVGSSIMRSDDIKTMVVELVRAGQ
jgi:indole-3-glycerol phosphate synthase